MYRTDLRIGEVVKRFVSQNIPSSWPFRIYFLVACQCKRYEKRNEKQSLCNDIIARILIPPFAHNHNSLRL